MKTFLGFSVVRGLQSSLGCTTFFKAKKWFRNPLKQIRVQPVQEWTHVPDAGEGLATFQFGLRFSNVEEPTVMISALQARHYLSGSGVMGISPVQICRTTERCIKKLSLELRFHL